MFDKLDVLLEKFDEISTKIIDPDVISDQATWQKLMKEQSELKPIVDKYTRYKQLKKTIEESKDIIKTEKDDEIIELAKIDLEDSQNEIETITEDIKLLLIPKDKNDEKNVIMEIRAGAGGDEAGLFASELMRLYTRFAERHKFKTEIMDINESGIGGIKEVTMLIKGNGAYSKLKFESGVHRVQRIPSTDSGGRIHTSTATVAVLPEVDDVEVVINQNDVRVDVFRSSGNGGQSVNTTDSAVRLTHTPTGIVVSCQDEKSQLKNKDKAMKILKARIYEIELQKQHDEISQSRKLQVGTGERSEKIRTYNYPQSRVTDHRIGMTVYKLDQYLDGDIDEMLDSLRAFDLSERLQQAQS